MTGEQKLLFTPIHLVMREGAPLTACGLESKHVIMTTTELAEMTCESCRDYMKSVVGRDLWLDEEKLKAEEPALRIYVNQGAKMSRGKYAAQAVHAALIALGVHPGVPVIVLGANRSEIEKLKFKVNDAGRTEVEPGTLTAGTDGVQ